MHHRDDVRYNPHKTRSLLSTSTTMTHSLFANSLLIKSFALLGILGYALVSLLLPATVVAGYILMYY